MPKKAVIAATKWNKRNIGSAFRSGITPIKEIQIEEKMATVVAIRLTFSSIPINSLSSIIKNGILKAPADTKAILKKVFPGKYPNSLIV